MVNLTRIYTRTGDTGTTRLSDNSVAAKTDPRVEAYGDVDEANSLIGVAIATGDLPARVVEILDLIRNELFDVGADLSNPVQENPKWEPLRILESSVQRLEHFCDELGDPLPNLRSFILPGGRLGAAHLHVARTVVRRAERHAWICVETHGRETMNLAAIQYLNRLSDLLFIMTRVANGTESEILWVPGGERDQS